MKFTSGALNGFIFFVQFIDTMLIDANGFISTHKALDTFMSIYLFMYRMFNLNFFTIDRLSFCLWEGANTLDIFAFKYVTVVYSIVLVLVTVLLKKFGKGKCSMLQKSKSLGIIQYFREKHNDSWLFCFPYHVLFSVCKGNTVHTQSRPNSLNWKVYITTTLQKLCSIMVTTNTLTGNHIKVCFTYLHIWYSSCANATTSSGSFIHSAIRY